MAAEATLGDAQEAAAQRLGVRSGQVSILYKDDNLSDEQMTARLGRLRVNEAAPVQLSAYVRVG